MDRDEQMAQTRNQAIEKARQAVKTHDEWIAVEAPDNYEAEIARAVVDALLPQVTTVDERDAVPTGAVVQSSAGTLACRYDRTRGVVFGDERPFPWDHLALPLTIVWQP